MPFVFFFVLKGIFNVGKHNGTNSDYYIWCHSDVTGVKYAHFSYFSHVDPQKVWNIGKIAIGPGAFCIFLLLHGIFNVEKHNTTNSDHYMASQ